MMQRLLIGLAIVALMVGALVVPPLMKRGADQPVARPVALSTQIRRALGDLHAGEQLEASAALPDGMVDLRAFDAAGHQIRGCVVAPGYACDTVTAVKHGTRYSYSGTIESAPATRNADLVRDALVAMRTMGDAQLSVAPIGHTLRAPGSAGRDVAVPIDRGMDTLDPFYGKVLTVNAGAPVWAVMALAAYTVREAIPKKVLVQYSATVLMAAPAPPIRLLTASMQHGWDPKVAKLLDFDPQGRVGAAYSYLPSISNARSKVVWEGTPTLPIALDTEHPVSFPSIGRALASSLQLHYEWHVNITTCAYIGRPFPLCIA